MSCLRKLFVILVATGLAGCATESFSPDQAPEYITIQDYVAFYRLGPMQSRGPDATLRVDTRLKLLRREMGYSYVELADQRTGYVANDGIAPAPPRPPAPPASASSGDDSSDTRPSRKKRGTSSPRYTGEQLNDEIPLPDPNVPPPDLNIAPEEVIPPTTPAVTPPPEKPKFRY